jgi:predicted RNA-binding Zn-ribbon protein involved in translation (DUF1610 family)
MYTFTCPKCGTSDQIDIDATVRVRIVDQDTEGNFGTDADASEDGSHEWDATSGAYCAHCGYSGTVDDFEKDDDGPQPDEEEEDAPGLCVTCGTQCEARPDLSVICPKCEAEEQRTGELRTL